MSELLLVPKCTLGNNSAVMTAEHGIWFMFYNA